MLGPANNRPPHEAILFFHLSEKSVVLILFLKKLDMDNNFFVLRELEVMYPHIQYTHNVLNVSVFQEKKKKQNQTAATAPLSRAPGLVSKALPESQGVPSGLIHTPPEFRDRLSPVSEASEGQTAKFLYSEGKSRRVECVFMSFRGSGEEPQSLLLAPWKRTGAPRQRHPHCTPTEPPGLARSGCPQDTLAPPPPSSQLCLRTKLPTSLDGTKRNHRAESKATWQIRCGVRA